MAFWAYILLCADGSYYTGHTDNLDARIGAHRSGAFEGYTRQRRPVTLVWSQDFATRLEALDAERQIKGWSRAKKEALIASDWQALTRLARNRQAEPRPSRLSAHAARENDGTSLATFVRAEPIEAQVPHHTPSERNP